jgi:hypothetical protein
MVFDPRSGSLNYVVVNGVPSPGRATITGAAIPYNYDVKQGYGLSGATTVFRGRGVAKFTVTIELWERAQYAAWAVWSKFLEPPKPGIKLVVEMQHPVLAAQDIKAVAVESLGALERQSNGSWKCVIQCLEWRPPLPALVKPRGAIPGVAGGKVIPPKTEADIALEKARLDFETARAAARTGT